MQIRTYRPGDEAAQVRVYNAAAAELPGFKPALVDEVARRYRAAEFDPGSKYYAEEGGEVVGYATFSPNGRVSVPWCLPGHESASETLLDALLAAMRDRGLARAWAAYREDWRPVQDWLDAHGFEVDRRMINYVAPVDVLPRAPLAKDRAVAPAAADDWAKAVELAPHLFDGDAASVEAFYAAHPDLDPASAFALRDPGGRTLGVGLAVIDPRFAAPTQVDPAMPCFRLGAFGTESQRHKRVCGLVAAAFAAPADGDALLAEAARRLAAAGLTHAAAQAPSDQPQVVELFDRHFQHQGGFPVRCRSLAGA